MKKILGLVVLSLFAISASATDLMALSAAPGAQPAMSQNTFFEGSACPGIGATGFSSTGLLLSCQSGSWIGVGSSPQSLATNGWKQFPGGLILQWGKSTWACVTFPRPFPAQVFNIGSQYTGTHHEQGVSNVTLNGFCPTTNMMTSDFYWIAWGR